MRPNQRKEYSLNETQALIYDTFRAAEMLTWESEEHVWRHIREVLGCSLQHAYQLGTQMAFVSPFRANGLYRGRPEEGTCTRCGQAPKKGLPLCKDHAAAAEKIGPTGEYRYLLFCTDGRTQHEEPAVVDEYGVPRCPACKKSALRVPFILLLEREKERQRHANRDARGIAETVAKRKATLERNKQQARRDNVVREKEARVVQRILTGRKAPGRKVQPKVLDE